eukprot:775356-Rhodomonas_salina.2
MLGREGKETRDTDLEHRVAERHVTPRHRLGRSCLVSERQEGQRTWGSLRSCLIGSTSKPRNSTTFCSSAASLSTEHRVRSRPWRMAQGGT